MSLFNPTLVKNESLVDLGVDTVRTTFTLSEYADGLIEVAARWSGSSQKDLLHRCIPLFMEHIRQDAQVGAEVERKVKLPIGQPSVRATRVITTGVKQGLEQLAKKYSCSRDAILEALSEFIYEFYLDRLKCRKQVLEDALRRYEAACDEFDARLGEVNMLLRQDRFTSDFREIFIEDKQWIENEIQRLDDALPNFDDIGV